jgi:DNA-binding GntR family transcriptional regulator
MSTPTLHINRPRVADEQSLADRAYYAIREWIVTLDLAPGSVVNERELMERLGVGRTPVREALRDLAREQLVDVFPRRGMFVSGVDVGDIAGLSEVRRVLEGEAARLAAERRNDRDREATQALLDELARTARTDGGEAARARETGGFSDLPRHRRGSGSGSPLGGLARAKKADERRLIDLDERIHRHVARCAHNPFLEATLEEYYVLALRIWFLALERVALDEAIAEHHAILEAIRDGDPDRAEDVMRAHVTSFERAIRAVL